MIKELEGKVTINKKGFGFVKAKDGSEYFLPKKNRLDCLHGDVVQFEVVEPPSTYSPKAVIKVIKVKEKAREYIVGVTKIVDGRKTLIADDPKIFERLVIKDFQSLEPNFKILFKIERVDCGTIFVKKEKDIGHRNAIGVDILSIVSAYGIKETFSIEASKEASKIPPIVLDTEKENRVDLRNKIIITIDGASAKDLDDAIRVEKLDNGNFLLGVYIADVSYYVKFGSPIDKEAYNRATSIYLADRVIPMLPKSLSNGICSLNSKVDRLVMSCEMEFNTKGDLINSKIFEGIINTTEKMIYSDVNKIYNEDKILSQKYSHILELLNNAKELAKILSNKKQDLGMIDFDIEESEIIINEKGKAVDIKIKERGFSEKMIENFMVAANETVASTIEKLELPSIYRVHGVPPLEKLNDFYKFARHFGEHFEAKQVDIKSIDIQKILKLYVNKPYYFSITVQLLRSMDKARYSQNNIGHFGLASTSYSHFTSPIRRYPDLILHRLIRDYILNNSQEKVKSWVENLDSMCEHTSDRERRAIECERTVAAMKKAEWATNRLKIEYEASIVSLIEFGMFIRIPNGIEGLIHINDIYDDEYELSVENYAIKGKEKKREFKPGDSIKVFIKRASKQSGKIDFGLTEFKEVTIENDRLRIEEIQKKEEEYREARAKYNKEKQSSNFSKPTHSNRSNKWFNKGNSYEKKI